VHFCTHPARVACLRVFINFHCAATFAIDQRARSPIIANVPYRSYVLTGSFLIRGMEMKRLRFWNSKPISGSSGTFRIETIYDKTDRSRLEACRPAQLSRHNSRATYRHYWRVRIKSSTTHAIHGRKTGPGSSKTCVCKKNNVNGIHQRCSTW
jgi:hypothetical protein